MGRSRGGRWEGGKEGRREETPAQGPALIFIHAIVNVADLGVELVVRREGDEAREERVQRPLPLVEHLNHGYSVT